MIPIPYLKEALAGACLLLVLACVGLGVALKTANARLDARGAEVVALKQQVELAGQQVLTSLAKIDEQNERIRKAELLGAKAAAAQTEIDRMAAQLNNQKALLAKIQLENIDLRERVEGLSLCETYELCLRSIAGVLP